MLEHSEARATGKEPPMATTESSASAAHQRLRTILKEALDRLHHEMMSEEEQQVLLDRVRRLRKSLAA